LTLSKTTRLFVDAKFLKKVLPVAKEAGVKEVYVLKGHAKDRKGLHSIIKDVRARKIPAIDVRPATKDTLAYLVFSSGTSGLPKGASCFFRRSVAQVLKIPA